MGFEIKGDRFKVKGERDEPVSKICKLKNREGNVTFFDFVKKVTKFQLFSLTKDKNCVII
jgi:hypothetical protein